MSGDSLSVPSGGFSGSSASSSSSDFDLQSKGSIKFGSYNDPIKPLLIIAALVIGYAIAKKAGIL